MTTDARKRANAKYDKSHTQSVMLKFNKQTDADILMKLSEVDNRQGYIKKLIREDMSGDGGILTIDAIRMLIQPVAMKYDLDKVYVFGSYARGEATSESDVDLAIEGGNIRGMFEFLDLQEKMAEVIGKKVDVVERKVAQNDKSRSGRRFFEHMERDGVLIYG